MYPRLLVRLEELARGAAGPSAVVARPPVGRRSGGGQGHLRGLLAAGPRRPGTGSAGRGGEHAVDGVAQRSPGTTPRAGQVLRVNGPLVEVTGLAGVAMFDVVDVGREPPAGRGRRHPRDVATVQAYEYTGGLAPERPARSRGAPLSAPLGPHLLGGIFDGLLRPLSGAGVWLGLTTASSAPGSRQFAFAPSLTAGAVVARAPRCGHRGRRRPVPTAYWCRPASADQSSRCGPLARARRTGSSRPWPAPRSASPSSWPVRVPRPCPPAPERRSAAAHRPARRRHALPDHPWAAAPRCPAASEPARPCCSSRSPSGPMPT